MATVNREVFAELVPTRPPGVTAHHLHSAAREIWPAISLGSVIGILSTLIRDGRARRVDALDGNHRYHLETS